MAVACRSDVAPPQGVTVCCIKPSTDDDQVGLELIGDGQAAAAADTTADNQPANITVLKILSPCIYTRTCYNFLATQSSVICVQCLTLEVIIISFKCHFCMA